MAKFSGHACVALFLVSRLANGSGKAGKGGREGGRLKSSFSDLK